MNKTDSQIQETKTKTKQTTRTGIESQKWRSHGGLSAGRGRRESGKGTGNKKHNWQVQNRQGEFKNNIGNGEAKELTRMTHGHELRGQNASGRWGTGWMGIKEREKWDNCGSIINKIYLKIKKKQR